MRTVSAFRALIALASACVLSACMSVGVPSPYPDRYPGYPEYPEDAYGQQLVGDVVATDHANGRFMLADERGGSYGRQVEIVYDGRTTLYYQGRTDVGPQGLERGDRIRVHGTPSRSGYYATRIEVLRNVRDGQPGYGNTQLQGSVTAVDTGNRSIRYTEGGYSGSVRHVRYDANTRVEWQGRQLYPEQLQRGDVIRIQARQQGGEWWAERIYVDVPAATR